MIGRLVESLKIDVYLKYTLYNILMTFHLAGILNSPRNLYPSRGVY